MTSDLKLKKIGYINAEVHAAGEMKHGPIALIDDGVPVIVIARGGRASPSDRTVRRRSPMGFLKTIYVGEFVGF